MLESIKNVWTMLEAVGFYPWVTFAGLAVYFIIRQRWAANDDHARRAAWVPVLISFIGQLGYAWPKTAQDIFQCFTMGIVQAGVSLGVYSFLDKYGITDRLGRIVQKKLDDKGAANDAPVPPADH